MSDAAYVCWDIRTIRCCYVSDVGRIPTPIGCCDTVDKSDHMQTDQQRFPACIERVNVNLLIASTVSNLCGGGAFSLMISKE